MIRRDDGDGYLLITQDEHARLSGELARRIGNGRFARVEPFEASVEGVRMHDAGWPLHDDRPTLNKDGLPLHVFEVGVPIAVEVWSESVRRAMGAGDWQGLLVSLHVLNLSAFSMAHLRQPSRPEVFEVNKFQHRQIEVQEELRKRLGLRTDVPLRLGLAAPGASELDDQLLFDFRVLTFMDRVSLSLCCGKDLFPRVEDVMGRPGEAPAPIALETADARTLVVDPWPFGDGEIVTEVGARRVGRGPYGSVEEFRAVYGGAGQERVGFVVRPR